LYRDFLQDRLDRQHYLGRASALGALPRRKPTMRSKHEQDDDGIDIDFDVDVDPEGDQEPGDPREREAELRQAASERRIRRYRSLVLHWMVQALRRPRRAKAAPLPSVTPGQVGISFAGHACTLIRYADLNVVCDPMLGRWVGAAKREQLPGLSPAELHDVDLILISNTGADHLHRRTLAKLPRSATVVLPQRTAQRVSDLGFARVVELGIGQSIQHRSVDVATTPVLHGQDAAALSYVIRGDGPSVYYCGQSGYFSGFGEIGRRYQPDIAVLPIGGYSPLSFRDRHMTPMDALYAFEDLRARVMIPIRYGAFALSYERLFDPARWLADLVRESELEQYVIELAPGESRVFVPPRKPARQRTLPGADSARSTPDSQAAGPALLAPFLLPEPATDGQSPALAVRP
jgi:L-ascorbate metabolism protein UlaG (beta-lactamase superfamily)